MLRYQHSSLHGL